MRGEVADRAIGRWHGILSTLGVGKDYLINKHGPCPVCGGRDRYRWDNKEGKGTFYCSNCGAGDGFKLLMQVKGWDFKRAATEVESIIGTATIDKPAKVMSDAECKAAIAKRWRHCVKLSPGDMVDRYLVSRLGVSILPKVLRNLPDRPGMAAMMQGPDGKGVMLHQTFLTEDGRKADVEKPRLMMKGQMPPGSAVRLAEHGGVLGIAEGIETALSATIVTGVPCWASLNEVMLRKWKPPASVKRVVVFGDNDRSFVGQAAAYDLARTLSLSKDPPAVEVMIPKQAGSDWNDVLREGGE